MQVLKSKFELIKYLNKIKSITSTSLDGNNNVDIRLTKKRLVFNTFYFINMVEGLKETLLENYKFTVDLTRTSNGNLSFKISKNKKDINSYLYILSCENNKFIFRELSKNKGIIFYKTKIKGGINNYYKINKYITKKLSNE